MICACAQSIASLANLFSPLPANVAAMGSVNANAGAQAALGAALSANAALTASAALSANVAVPFNVGAMLSLTAVANGVGALRLGMRMNLAGGNCAPTLDQLANAIANHALMKALGGLPLGALPPLQALAQLANALAAANAMGVALMSANAAAQLNAQAQAAANAAAQASGGMSASAAASLQAFLAMQAALSANLGVNIGAPGGVGMLGVALGSISSNMSALNALNGLLNAALLTQVLALLNALAAIQKALGLNLLLPGAGLQVQPKLAALSKSLSGGMPSKGLSKNAAKSANKSATKALNNAVARAYSDGLANALTGLPILPPAALLLAYLLQKLLGQLGVGLIQYSQCGPLCLIHSISLPCPFTAADFAERMAEQGQQLALPEIAAPTVATNVSTSRSSNAGASSPSSSSTSTNTSSSASAVGEAVQYGAAPKSDLGFDANAPTAPDASRAANADASPANDGATSAEEAARRRRASWWKK